MQHVAYTTSDTTKAEYIALLQVMYNLIPFVYLAKKVMKVFHIELFSPDEVQWKGCGNDEKLVADVYVDNHDASKLSKVSNMHLHIPRI